MSIPTELVRGKIINPINRAQWQYFEDGALTLDAQGRIVAVGEWSVLSKTPGITQTWDYTGSLIMPGLIDTHIHLPQFPIRGKSAGSLLAWLTQAAYPIEEAFAMPDYAKTLSQLFFNQLKAHGTTTALVMSSVHEESTHLAFEAAAQSGMRVLMGKVMMDQQVPASLLETTDASVTASQRLANTWHGREDGLISYAFTPRYALSCSQELLQAAADLQKAFPGSLLHSHLAENRDEVTQVEALYGNRYSYTQVYEQGGCLGPYTVLAHGLHLLGTEMKLLKQTGTGVAHCPTSNFFLKSGFFNLPAYLQYGVPFGLGTDIGAGPDISLFRVMRGLCDMQLSSSTFVTPMEALYDATLGGAHILALSAETGNFLPGKSADFIVLQLPDPKENILRAHYPDTSIENTISQLMYEIFPVRIQSTVVRGKVIYSQPTK